MWAVVEAQKEERMRSFCLLGTEFQFCKRKGVLVVDGGDGYTTIRM